MVFSPLQGKTFFGSRLCYFDQSSCGTSTAPLALLRFLTLTPKHPSQGLIWALDRASELTLPCPSRSLAGCFTALRSRNLKSRATTLPPSRSSALCSSPSSQLAVPSPVAALRHSPFGLWPSPQQARCTASCFDGLFRACSPPQCYLRSPGAVCLLYRYRRPLALVSVPTLEHRSLSFLPHTFPRFGLPNLPLTFPHHGQLFAL